MHDITFDMLGTSNINIATLPMVLTECRIKTVCDSGQLPIHDLKRQYHKFSSRLKIEILDIKGKKGLQISLVKTHIKIFKALAFSL